MPERSRLTIDLPAELRRKVKVAAAAEDRSVSDYIVHLLERSLGNHTPFAEPTRLTEEICTSMDELRERIFARTGFVEPSSEEVIRTMREERTRQLERAIRGDREA